MGLVTQVLRFAPRYNVSVVLTASFDDTSIDSLGAILDGVKNTRCNIVLLLTSPFEATAQLINQAKIKNMTSYPYTFLVTDSNSGKDFSDILQDGLLGTNLFLDRTSANYTTFRNSYTEAYSDLLQHLPSNLSLDMISSLNASYLLDAAYGYDALYVAAKAIHRKMELEIACPNNSTPDSALDNSTIATFSQLFQNRSDSFCSALFSYANRGVLVQDLIRSFPHSGITGNISFTASGELEQGRYSLFNLQGGKWVDVGFASVDTHGSIDIVHSTITFAGNSSVIPPYEYLNPIVTQIYHPHCNLTRVDNLTLTDCPRSGSNTSDPADRLTILGTYFGFASPNVLIGGRACPVYTWSETNITCALPGGWEVNATVNVIQAGGSFNSHASIGYVPCQGGFFQNPDSLTTCTECSAGRFNSILGVTSCNNCPIGRYQNRTAQRSCLPCNLGFFSNATSPPTGATVCRLISPDQ